MVDPVFLTGLGIISAIGNDVNETIDSFVNHRSGIGPCRFLNTVHKDIFPLGEVKMSNAEIASIHGLDSRLSRTILLSYHAALAALKTIPSIQNTKWRKGFISGSSVGGMDRTEFFFEDFCQDPLTGDLRDVMNHDCGKATDFVAERIGFKDFVSTLSTACSSSANSIMLGARLIKAGKLDIVIAGGVDSLTKFTLNGFNSLMIVDKEQCRPLDESRVGLNLGEGAAYVVLMSEKVLKELDLDPYCRLSGYANSNDSFHQTALSNEGNGPFLAMEAALKMSGLIPTQIDYINMHGTGTQNNDMAEGKAVERIFHPHYPKLSSTKSFTGHTLGASGGVEAVLSALAIKEGYLFPNYQYKNQMSNLDIVPETKFQKGQTIRNVLSNSFGFGGNCTALVFSK
ncbi:MAG: beta-ketoacyl-[acyl-carrier-protein] synthase family protein [Bacteroidetes bacterium]|nr:MAG: beta-ketoacyl-[acyl-carrier-protein] synthase family protein [Bacteroidota bacterium]